MDQPREDDPSKTSFLQVLLYTFGLIGAMALLAAVAVWLLRLFSK